jgi:tetratricopeptide (TPR) repeat protein
MVDPLTQRDLQDLYERTAEKNDSAQAAAEDWLLLGQAYYAFGYFSAATPCFQHAAAMAPNMSYPKFLVGVSLARTGALQEAIDEFRQALRAAGEREKPALWHEMGRCYLRLENARSAEDCFVNAGEHVPALVQLAKLRIQAGRAQDAAAPLNALARLQPTAVEVFLLNARAASLLGDEVLAQRFRDRAEYNADRLPTDAVTQMVDQVRKQYGAFKLGDEAAKLVESENWEDAAALLREDYAATRNRGAVFHLAGAELECQRPEAAIELLEAFMNERGAFPAGMVLLGDAYLAAGRAADAQEAWEQTAAYYSAPELHRRLAQRYELAGRADDARKQRGLALQATGIDQLRHSNPSAARATLESAVAEEPSLATAWFYLGECRRVLGDAEQAREAYRKSLALEPDHGRALRGLGLVGE